MEKDWITRKEMWALYDAIRKQQDDGQLTREEADKERSKLHHRYFLQFITEGTIRAVEARIGLDRILSSTGPYFNDIPLVEWDRLAGVMQNTLNVKAKRNAEPVEGKPHAYLWALNDATCMAKTAARVLIERNTKQREG